jgi:hypothetical protein
LVFAKHSTAIVASFPSCLQSTLQLLLHLCPLRVGRCWPISQGWVPTALRGWTSVPSAWHWIVGRFPHTSYWKVPLRAFPVKE